MTVAVLALVLAEAVLALVLAVAVAILTGAVVVLTVATLILKLAPSLGASEDDASKFQDAEWAMARAHSQELKLKLIVVTVA